jgi:hypothetical protein
MLGSRSAFYETDPIHLVGKFVHVTGTRLFSTSVPVTPFELERHPSHIVVMDNIDQPAWLKIMEHGSVGEARTKAFLLDRFWVLERSVDIDGADFLVQPRALGARFTDRSPPKIGVIQAKYFQDRRTVHHIPRRYVVDEYGLPLKGFFALLHVGQADDARIYMMSATEMVAELDQTDESPGRFIVGGKALADKFRVDNHRRQALDRIAHDITTRSPTDSIHFLDRVNVPFHRITTDDIDYHYKLPIPNEHADIPATYLEYRDRLSSLTYEIEQALEIIDVIMKTQDPRQALSELERLEEYRGGSGYRDTLAFSSRKLDFDWPYFAQALDDHDNRVSALELINKLKPYVDLSHRLRMELDSRVAKLAPNAREGHYVWARFDYDPATLAFERVRLSLADAKPGKSKSRLSRSRYLNVHKGKVQLEDAGCGLWHALMTKILFDLCPELNDDEDQ